MQASSKTPGLMRSDGSRHFPRRPLPVCRQANVETKGRDPVFAAAPDRESDSRLRLPASRAGELNQPRPGHLREQPENNEEPFPDHPEPGRSLRLPRQRAVLLGQLRPRVRHSLPARWYAPQPGRPPLNPTSTVLRKDPNVWPPNTPKYFCPDLRRTVKGFGRAVRDIQ